MGKVLGWLLERGVAFRAISSRFEPGRMRMEMRMQNPKKKTPKQCSYLAVLQQADDVLEAVVAEEDGLQDRPIIAAQHGRDGIYNTTSTGTTKTSLSPLRNPKPSSEPPETLCFYPTSAPSGR